MSVRERDEDEKPVHRKICTAIVKEIRSMFKEGEQTTQGGGKQREKFPLKPSPLYCIAYYLEPSPLPPINNDKEEKHLIYFILLLL